MGRVYLRDPQRNKFPWGHAGGVGVGHRRCASLLLALALTAAPVLARAEGLYRYVDERGVVHFTNLRKDARWKRIRKPRGLTRVSTRHRESVPAEPPADVRRFDPLIVQHSEAQGVPPALVKAVIRAESAFDPHAVSAKGAMGLMQLMPGTADMLGVAEPFQPEANIEGGTRYLRELHDRYGSWTFTLAAYNAGPTAVDRYRGVPPFDETRNYVRRVLSFYRRYHGDFPR